MKKVSTLIIAIICLIAAIAACFGAYKYYNAKDPSPGSGSQTEKPSTPPKEYKDTDYNVKLIKTVNSTQDGNYLISPYSIEIALNMLKSGAKEDTYKQIDDVVGSRDIPVFSVKDRISVTNGAFIKEEYKELIEKDYYDKLASFDAEIIFDKFATPDKINNWVKEHTYGMIPKILDTMSKDFVLGIANAVAIDVEWYSQFECQNTNKAEFTKSDGKKMNVQMMHAMYEHEDFKYFETEDAKGVILPYTAYDKDGLKEYDSKEKEFTQLEFVGILPNEDVDKYIEGLTSDKLAKFDEKVTTGAIADIIVSLPRFSYSFDLANFMDVLKAMGIKDVFDPTKSNLTGIINQNNLGKMDAVALYVSEAIHKTYIDLNEKGTKAAAITYFGMDKASSVAPQREKKRIEFNKPFVYMIRDSKTKEILFFGVVETPNEWKGSTCEEE